MVIILRLREISLAPFIYISLLDLSCSLAGNKSVLELLKHDDALPILH
jgi:hypothetical protein